jgi:hypothetical protein
MAYYVGDPCYIIDDDDWSEFCQLTFDKENQRPHANHIDSVIQWRGQELTIWSNGGDGYWSWEDSGIRADNGATGFGVDAGIYCVIDLDFLHVSQHALAENNGMVFEDEPEFWTERGIIYLDGEPDDSDGETGW